MKKLWVVGIVVGLLLLIVAGIGLGFAILSLILARLRR